MLTNSSSENKVSQATTPVIVSASRSTDIPAFYAKWFVNRLAAGYAVWYNPFNQQPMKISFEKTKVVVFWTKNPAPLIPYLHELDEIVMYSSFVQLMKIWNKRSGILCPEDNNLRFLK